MLNSASGSKSNEDENNNNSNVDLKKIIKLGLDEEEKTGDAQNVEVDKRPSDCNQWIRYPPLIQKITARIGNEDDDQVVKEKGKGATNPESVAQKLSDQDVGILNDYVNMWKKSIEQLLDRLKDTIPAEGMIGEVHYWRDLSRILDGIQGELKQPQVEMTIQILLMRIEFEKKKSGAG